MRNSLFILLFLISLPTFSQEKLQAIEVAEAETFFDFWEENQEAKIFSGKKNTITALNQIPQLQSNNYRQATSQTPGLLISEVPNESLAAITYRGLGDPHESFNVLLLQDGIPVAADMYGYPAHYFSPALPMMEKFQFIRGGASLLYGPQPGGVVNYISTPLRKGQKLSSKAGLTGGSNKFLSTNDAIYGSTGDTSWGVEYFRRQGDGPRRVNSDFYADYLQARTHTFKGKKQYKLAFNGYNSDHGEPGGHAKSSVANGIVFGKDEGKATKEHDRLKVSRAQLSAGLDKEIDDSSKLHINLWANAYRRYSKRQSGSAFGAFPTGTTNDITTQHYYGYNGEIRYLKNYSAFGNEHTFTAGWLNFNLISPLTSETGAHVDSNSGTLTRRVDRKTHTNSLFVENRFTLGRLMLTPGVRLENIRQIIDERKGPNSPLREVEQTVNVPLFGMALAYHLGDDSQLYGNVSEAYKPVSFAEAVPLNASTTISDDIDPSKVTTYEAGWRGQRNHLIWDASVFFIRYENKFGQVGTGAGINFQNTGAGESKGIDLAGEYKLTDVLNLYANFSLLDAKVTNGPLEGKTPQYAPKTITRTGLIYNKEGKIKAALMGAMVGGHFGNDNNTSNFEIPYYTVWDLTADWNFTQNWTASGGINNLLDREYYSRVRSDGIQWALGRNFYAGFSYKF